MMTEWNNFSAFDGVYELEFLADLLHGWAAAGSDVAKLNPPDNRYDFETGEKSELWKRLDRQATETEAIIEKEKHGLYPRTDIAKNFNHLFVVLGEVAENPYLLASELPDIVLRLHKVLIYAHDIFDPEHRKVMIAKAENQARAEETERNAQREKQRQSERGKKGKRGPSPSSGATLVKEVKSTRKRSNWISSWNYLVRMAEDIQCVGDFKILSHQDDVVYYRINGNEKHIKKATFRSYWQKKNEKKGRLDALQSNE